MANLTKEDIRSVIETIKELYLEDMIPWICGYSGGKDSTAVVQLVWYALQELPKEKQQSPSRKWNRQQKNRVCPLFPTD